MVTVGVIAGARTSGYPRVAFHGNELVFASTETEGGRTSVKTTSTKVAITTTAAR
jgi:hypothetical protein